MIRVMVVDDSGVYRMLLSKALKEYPDIDVVGSAVDGQEAIGLISKLKPDVITLDMNMPRMNGMETLAVLAVKHPDVQVIVVAAETRNDAERVVMVLEAGAFEMVLKPKASDATPMQTLREALYPKLKAAAERKSGLNQQKIIPRKPAAVMAPRRVSGVFTPDIVAIGSSTGGPAALHAVIGALPADFPVPVIVIQHMPKLFIESLARRLDRDFAIHCLLAQENMELKAGHVYFNPGETHMDVVRATGGGLTIRFNDGEPEHHCKPAVDVVLRSLHHLAPTVRTLVVILTGMGADGAAGAHMLSEANARVIAQDQQSSVVWGMPGETVKLGAADEVLPLDEIGAAIIRIGRCSS